ncbi:uncharacterized protein BCR38DRAFT_483182 [Pseudomassariella vexata]|uniref:2EXR domain-containing protein n=1 Tax=Pseudomassariella vexata TaxID=1141098 RepID=A0A1Y2E806_9PEZI|nr:uncharacterized protein BCR38DRAFT_483182 [Pseudomassariella vexata]ORY67567.1 hypothetical protein BCR38DRAFT_483182 [Pseudomassariella vexata]
MVKFHKFPQLPFELQDQIWDASLQQDIRLILLNDNDRRIYPTTHLSSALLTVNAQSRKRALVAYPTKLNIWSTNQEDRSKGCVHVNIEKDIFFLEFSGARILENKWWQEKWLNIPSVNGHRPWEIPFNNHATPLPREQCGQIRLLRELQWDPYDMDPVCCWECKYSDIQEGFDDIEPFMDRALFSSVSSESCQLLMMTSTAGEMDFLLDISRLSGEEFLKTWGPRFVTYDFQRERDWICSALSESSEDTE